MRSNRVGPPGGGRRNNRGRKSTIAGRAETWFRQGVPGPLWPPWQPLPLWGLAGGAGAAPGGGGGAAPPAGGGGGGGAAGGARGPRVSRRRGRSGPPFTRP